MLSQRPGPQGGGSWAHSSTSSSHAEPRKPAGHTQWKEPGRFSQSPRPHRPGLWMHSSTSAQSKGPGHTSSRPLLPAPMLYSTSLTSIALTFHPPSFCHLIRHHSNSILHPSTSSVPVKLLVCFLELCLSSPYQWASLNSVLHNSTPFPINDVSIPHPSASPSSMTQPFCFPTLGLSIPNRLHVWFSEPGLFLPSISLPLPHCSVSPSLTTAALPFPLHAQSLTLAAGSVGRSLVPSGAHAQEAAWRVLAAPTVTGWRHAVALVHVCGHKPRGWD